MSLSKQIVAYLASQYPLAVHSGELERMAMENQYKASNCGRRCRELQNDGLIEVIYNEKHEATYKWVPKGLSGVATVRTSNGSTTSVSRINPNTPRTLASKNETANQFLKDSEVKEDVELDINKLF